MTLPVIVFCGVTAFSLLLFVFAPETPSLVLLFSAFNALVTAFLGASLTLCAAVFVISFFVIFAVALSVSFSIDKHKRKKQEKSACEAQYSL